MAERNDALALGALLGGVDTAAIGIGMALNTSDAIGSLAIVALIMFAIGGVLGIALGWLASALEHRTIRERRVLIWGLPLLATSLGFCAIGLAEFALISCVPTLAATHYLELRTRAGEPLAVALASNQR